MKKDRDQVQSEVANIFAMFDRATAAVSMRVGKCLIGLRDMDLDLQEGDKFLVAYPSKSVKQGWLDDMVKFNLEHLKQHIVFTTYLSLPKQSLIYKKIYLDEIHSLKYSHDEWLSQYNGKIRGLTGTPPKFGKSEKGLMIEKYAPVKYSYMVKEAVEHNILNDYKIIVHKIALDTKKTMLVEAGNKRWYQSEVDSYNYFGRRIEAAQGNFKQEEMARIMRMSAMKKYPSKEVYAKRLSEEATGKFLIFANTKDQADKLCKYSYHSGNKDSEENLRKFKSGEIMILSAVMQLNEGITVPGLAESVIMHAYGNERKTPQRLARCLSLNPDETATIHILVFKGTVDEMWCQKALADFDQNKISYIDKTLE